MSATNRLIACSFGLLMLPILLCAQEKKACWLRDATSPAPATAYLLCEQGGMWTTTDSGTTWMPLSTGSSERHRAFAWMDTKRGVAVGKHKGCPYQHSPHHLSLHPNSTAVDNP